MAKSCLIQNPRLAYSDKTNKRNIALMLSASFLPMDNNRVIFDKINNPSGITHKNSSIFFLPEIQNFYSSNLTH